MATDNIIDSLAIGLGDDDTGDYDADMLREIRKRLSRSATIYGRLLPGSV